MLYLNRGKKQFSAGEKSAFHAGRAWARGKAGKRVNCNSEKKKKSFSNGVKRERERMRGGN